MGRLRLFQYKNVYYDDNDCEAYDIAVCYAEDKQEAIEKFSKLYKNTTYKTVREVEFNKYDVAILSENRMWLSKIKQVKEEIEDLKPNNFNFKWYNGETIAINNVLEILDKLINKSEDIWDE